MNLLKTVFEIPWFTFSTQFINTGKETFLYKKAMLWNIPSKCVKWSDEMFTFWALRLSELDGSLGSCPGCPFHFTDGKMDAPGHPPTLWWSRLVLGLLTLCSGYRMSMRFCMSSWDTQQGSSGHGWILSHTILTALTFSASFAPIFFQNIHSVDVLYRNLCLWFDEVS